MRGRLIALMVVSAGVLFQPVALRAQECLGNRSLIGGARVDASVTGQFASGSDGLRLGVYTGSSAFVGIHMGQASYAEPDAREFVLGGTLGTSLPVDGAVAVCTLVGLQRNFGFETLGSDISAVSLALGFAFAGALAINDDLSLIPPAQMAAVFDRTTVSIEGVGANSDIETYGVLSLSAALGFRDIVNGGPAIFIPLGQQHGELALGFRASFGLGRWD